MFQNLVEKKRGHINFICPLMLCIRQGNSVFIQNHVFAGWSKRRIRMAYKSIMKREYKARSGITMGGIGTGGIELRKDGTFYNFNIMNNYPSASGDRCNFASNSMLFFEVRYQEEGKNPKMKILQVDEGYEVGAVPLHYYVFPWMSGVDMIEYCATFPFVNMKFSDEEMPFDIEMEAYSPFIPGDVKNSA